MGKASPLVWACALLPLHLETVRRIWLDTFLTRTNAKLLSTAAAVVMEIVLRRKNLANTIAEEGNQKKKNKLKKKTKHRPPIFVFWTMNWSNPLVVRWSSWDVVSPVSALRRHCSHVWSEPVHRHRKDSIAKCGLKTINAAQTMSAKVSPTAI